MNRLTGKVALVTGGAQGLGQSLAARFLAEGCAGVVIADIDGVKAAATATALGPNALGIACDVRKSDDCDAAVEFSRKNFTRLDIAVANAGILMAEDILQFDPDSWRRVIDVNLVGYFNTARAAARRMAEQRSGVIVQINSKSGLKGSFRNSAYASSKFGGIGLTKSIALDLAPYGVRVNSVCPGNLLDSPLWNDSLYEQYARKWNLTVEQVRQKYEDQVPLGRGCTYDDVANAVVFLASDEAAYITGETIAVAGGQV